MRLLAIRFCISVFVLFGSSNAAFAQLELAAEHPVVYGHHHLNVSNAADHLPLWVGVLGGTQVTFGANTVVKFPNVLVFMREEAPTGETKGSTVNHIGFSVPDLRATLDAVEAAGFAVVTREELPPTFEVDDGIADVPAAGLRIAFIMAPDRVKIELVEESTQAVAADLHHVHLSAQEPAVVRDWYAATFGATPGRSGNFEVAELPGVTLSFLPSPVALAGTQGRSLDHLGFEIDGLEAFCRELEARGVSFDRPYREIPERGLALAYFTDPWGTYIELTEGLDTL